MLLTLLSHSLKRLERECKQISEQRGDMQMRSVTNFPEHVHPMYTAAASLQGEEYFANTRSLSLLTDSSHIITWAEMSMMST